MTKDPQRKMQDILDRLTIDGKELGLQLAVYHHGELIVDAWSGVMNKHSRQNVDKNTLFPVFSTFKGVIATLIHILAESNILDYNQRISEVWPAFGSRGKEEITLRDLLTHSAGLSQLSSRVTVEDLNDWDLMCEKIADLKVRWPRGTYCLYNPVTYSWTVGEFLRRITGREIMDLVRAEIGIPLDIKDMYCGLPDEAEPRVATIYEPDADPRTFIYGIPQCTMPLSNWMNRADVRRASIPSSNAITNAEGLARMYAALLQDGVDGVRLFPEDRLNAALEPFYAKNGGSPTFGIGYAIFAMNEDANPRVTEFGHHGFGGIAAYADRVNCVTVAMTKNVLSENDTWPLVLRELKDSLGL